MVSPHSGVLAFSHHGGPTARSKSQENPPLHNWEIHAVQLLPFLHDRNPQARQIALENLLGHTPAGSPHRSIFFAGLQSEALPMQTTKDTELVRDLKLLCRDQLACTAIF